MAKKLQKDYSLFSVYEKASNLFTFSWLPSQKWLWHRSADMKKKKVIIENAETYGKMMRFLVSHRIKNQQVKMDQIPQYVASCNNYVINMKQMR